MIFGKHQLQRGFGIFVIQHQCLFIGHIGSFGITKFQLYQPYNSIVDNSYEFRTDAFVYQSHPFRFNTSDTVGFDEYLICYGRRTKNAPRRTVIMKFLREQVTANRNDMFKLLLGIFHFLFSQCAAKIGIIKEKEKEGTLKSIKVPSSIEIVYVFMSSAILVPVSGLFYA